jgi:glycosyltransferase involved in cell wall biosynthesis
VIPLTTDIPGRTNGFTDRKNLVFIGGYLHRPNVDAVLYFVKEIWPLITEVMPDCEFWIVGSNVPDELKDLACEKIKVIGFVPDLEQVFSTCLMTVVPLRYGAGIKGKILTSLSYGVPCVATSIAIEGMGLTHDKNVLVGDTPAEFASAVMKLSTDIQTWERLSDNGLSILKEKYSLASLEKQLRNLVKDLNVYPDFRNKTIRTIDPTRKDNQEIREEA